MGVPRSDECAERVLAIVQPRYLVKLAVAGAISTLIDKLINRSLSIHLSLHPPIYPFVRSVSLPQRKLRDILTCRARH